MQKSKLDQFFSIPAAAVLMAIVCNVLWGSAFPFIKLGYRLFAIDSADTASILCFAGVRFMIGAALVWLAGLALNHRPLPMPRGKTLASACGLGLWQTAAQYFFYYSAVALLTGAMGGILHPQSAAGIPVLLFLAFISGAGYVIWALLMKNNPVSRIAVFGLIIPIMNVLLSALLNGEPLFEWNYLAALVLVCIGIFLVNRAPQTQETKA